MIRMPSAFDSGPDPTANTEPARFAGEAGAGAKSSAHPFWLSPPTALLGLIVFVIATALIAYSLARTRIEDGIRHTLSSIAQIKAEQIEDWLEERRVDMQVMVASPEFIHGVNTSLNSERNPDLARELTRHIQQTSTVARTDHFCLRSAVDGAPLLGSDCSDDSPALRQLAVTAARRNAAQLEDFHVTSDDPSAINVGMLCPVALAPGQPPRLVAQISMDPSTSLFPRLQRWPGGSTSAEVLLVRRDGNDALFLNALRYRSDRPLTYRQPLDDRGLLASQAIAGTVGLVRGHDYRGVAAVGYAMPIAGTPWFLIAKMDRSEAETWLTRLSFLVVFALALIILTGLWWWMERQRHVANMHNADLARAVVKERMDYLTRQTHDCIVLVDLAGRILETNEQCMNIYGYEVAEMLGRDGRELLSAAQPDGDLASLWQKLSTDGDLVLDTEQTRKDGAEVIVEISMRAFTVVDAPCIQAIVRDITERKRAEGRIEDLYQNAPCGYHSIDADGRFCLINNTELAWLGYRREEVVGRMRLADLLTDASKERFAKTFPIMRRLGFARDLELDFVRRDGSILPTLINATAIYAPDGSFVMTRSMVLNMSERKAMEKERERQAADLAELSHRLMSVQEDERRRLSAELHDRTSPNLAALDINLRSLAKCLPAALDGEAAMLLDDATALLADTADSIREVCADLRPPILDYAGLLSALQSYALQYSGRTGIAVDLVSPSQAMRFAPEVESTLFRIAQEALTNCAKHAHADNVRIRFDVGDRRIGMEITDDGIGFVPRALAKGSAPGLGLLSMRERARFAGGEFQVDSRPGSGTRLYVSIPIVSDRVRTAERRRRSPSRPARPAVPVAAVSVDSIIEG